MEQTITEAKEEMSDFAPRITTIMVKPEQVREIIGPGGKMIKKITADSGATIEIEDDGTVNIISNDKSKMEIAKNMIESIVKEVEAGEVYEGTVTRIMNFGAFVEVLPNKEGLVHISELEHHRVNRVEDVLNIGDKVKVKVIEIDSQGRINLSRKALLEKPEGHEGAEGRESRDSRRHNSGNRRDRDRGSRRNRKY
jgi:polyribonucleotide nucleotidyltransferase